jgi:TolA-binding protein
MGQGFSSLIRAYRDKPVESNRAAVARAVKTNLERLALAAVEMEAGNSAAALNSAISVPELADYAAFLRAQAWASRKQGAQSIQEADLVLAHQPESPLAAQSILMEASQLIELGRARDAVSFLRGHSSRLSPADEAWMLGRALEASNDLAGAAIQFQKVFYGFPGSAREQSVAGSLAEFRARLGEAFPPVTAHTQIARADRLRESGNPKLALAELEAALSQFGSAEREIAEVRIGAAKTAAGDHQQARLHLRQLNLTQAEADAERWHWVLVASRRLEDDGGAFAAMKELNDRHPSSLWRMESLVYFANSFLVRNEPDRYVPLYRACADGFPDHEKAAYCHWKVVWRQYLDERADAKSALRLHAERFPASEKRPAAIYFLGRIAQEAGALAEARAYFDALASGSPNSYYASLARSQLAALSRTAPDAAVKKWAAQFPASGNSADFTYDPPTRLRIRRAQMLASVGLDQWADQELRFGARSGAKPALMAMARPTREFAPSRASRRTT